VLEGLSGPEKVPYVMRLIEVGSLTPRGAASLLEVGHSLSTWPQLAGDVTLGAGAVAEAVRRIGLGEPLSSGRISLDVGSAFDQITSPTATLVESRPDATEHDLPTDPVHAIVVAANRAPSGGNVQPWTITASAGTVTIRLAPERTTAIDVRFRGSAVAVGAAVYNARSAAAAHGFVGEVDYAEPATTEHEVSPLTARIRLVQGTDADRAALHAAVLRRETNRHHGTGAPLPKVLADELADVAGREGARLHLLTSRTAIDDVAGICGAADRIRYLTPRMHAEMVSELRWPGDPDEDSGIDVRSLELAPGADLALEILRRPEVMAELAAWDGGGILGAETTARIESSSALAVVCVDGDRLSDYARGGSAVEAVWIAAQERGLAVQPISPSFFYVRDDEDVVAVAPGHAAELTALRSRYLDVVGIEADARETPALMLRLALAPPTTIRSRRRALDIDAPRLR
jgi:nitroreductase